MTKMTVTVVRERFAYCETLSLVWSGADYHARRWAETRSYPFALLVSGRVYVHNAVVKAAYLAPSDVPDLRFGAGRRACRYELVREDELKRCAVPSPSGGYGRAPSEAETEKDAGIVAAFSALLASL